MERQLRKAHGFSIVELMIAVVIGMLMSGAIISVFVQHKASNTQNSVTARMGENARYAMKFLSDDLLLTGFWGEMLDAEDIDRRGEDPNLDLAADCGVPRPGPVGVRWTRWVYDAREPVELLLEPSRAEALAAYPCIEAGEFHSGPGSSVLAVKHVAGASTPSCARIDDPAYAGCTVLDPPDDLVYLRTSGDEGYLTKFARRPGTDVYFGSKDTVVNRGVNDWRYLVHVYYISPSWDGYGYGGGVPTLVRRRLREDEGSGPYMDRQPLIEGVEGFHLQFGVDNDKDGVANFYTSAPTAEQIASAVTARLYVLVRATEPIGGGYVNEKTYRLGDLQELGPFNDSFLRRVYTSTILLRNSRASRSY